MKEIKDMNIGDTVYCRLGGNKALHKRNDELIEEWEIVKIGRKYITAKEKDSGYSRETQFQIENDYIEKTDYNAERRLYIDKQEILDEFDRIDILQWLRKQFSYYGIPDYSLEQLRQVKEILLEEKNND